MSIAMGHLTLDGLTMYICPSPRTRHLLALIARVTVILLTNTTSVRLTMVILIGRLMAVATPDESKTTITTTPFTYLPK